MGYWPGWGGESKECRDEVLVVYHYCILLVLLSPTPLYLLDIEWTAFYVLMEVWEINDI